MAEAAAKIAEMNAAELLGSTVSLVLGLVAAPVNSGSIAASDVSDWEVVDGAIAFCLPLLFFLSFDLDRQTVFTSSSTSSSSS